MRSLLELTLPHFQYSATILINFYYFHLLPPIGAEVPVASTCTGMKYPGVPIMKEYLECLGVPGSAWEYLGVLGVPGSTWEYLGVLGVPGSTWEYLGVPGSTWEYLGVFVNRSACYEWEVPTMNGLYLYEWEYLGAWEYLGVPV
jgi:hypothetical protein